MTVAVLMKYWECNIIPFEHILTRRCLAWCINTSKPFLSIELMMFHLKDGATKQGCSVKNFVTDIFRNRLSLFFEFLTQSGDITLF
jgi:hypothetical protein